jgi:glutamate synthase domain-containing protein 2
VTWWLWVLVVIVGALLLVATYDLTQRRSAILRNYPLIGHLRFMLESVGPELRQYIVTENDADKPFSRDERRWIYSIADASNPYFGFGTDNDVEGSASYLIVKHVAFPLPEPAVGTAGPPQHELPCAKVLGGARAREHAFRMPSAVNVSGMSFGSLSGAAVEALNRGAHGAGCLQATGEGGLTRHHRHGGDLVWQLGTGYFGCRDEHGRFSLPRFLDVVATTPTLRAVEIKLSQGAKPGVGGFLPAAKVTAEIADVRGVPLGVDCVSPPNHTAFSNADELLDFVETLAEACGLPIGIKTAIGHDDVLRDLAGLMADGDRGVDFVTVDGGEGGTGAGPLAFTDHVALPFKLAFARAYRCFAEADLTDRVVFVGSGKLGLGDSALLAFALGCDAVNVGREAMLAIGCIQSQRCHTGRCPTGVTTQSRWRMHGLDPPLKSVRCARYLVGLRAEILRLSRACGRPHPAFVTLDDFEILDGNFGSQPAREVFGYELGWGATTAPSREP